MTDSASARGKPCPRSFSPYRGKPMEKEDAILYRLKVISYQLKNEKSIIKSQNLYATG
jgi:hypothetical protein